MNLSKGVEGVGLGESGVEDCGTEAERRLKLDSHAIKEPFAHNGISAAPGHNLRALLFAQGERPLSCGCPPM